MGLILSQQSIQDIDDDQNQQQVNNHVSQNLQARQNRVNNQQRPGQQKQNEGVNNSKYREKLIEIPRFLERFSNTFFKRPDPKMTASECQKQIDLRKEQNRKNKETLKLKKELEQPHPQPILNSVVTEKLQQIPPRNKPVNHGRSVSSIQVLDCPKAIPMPVSRNVQPHPAPVFTGIKSPTRIGAFAQELFHSIKKGASQLLRPFQKSIQIPENNNSQARQQEQHQQNQLHSDFSSLHSGRTDQVISFPTTTNEEENDHNLIKLPQNTDRTQQKQIQDEDTELNLQSSDSQRYEQGGARLLNPIIEENSLYDQPKEISNLWSKDKQQKLADPIKKKDVLKHKRFFSIQSTQATQMNNSEDNYSIEVKEKQKVAEKANNSLLEIQENQDLEISTISNQTKQFAPDQSSNISTSRMDKSNITCLVCFDHPPDSVFMDCGHGGVCYDCSIEIWKKTGECYLCRIKIVQVLQVDIESKGKGLIKVISSTQMMQKEIDISELNNNGQAHPLEEIIEVEDQQE